MTQPPPLDIELTPGTEPPDAAIAAWARLLLALVAADAAREQEAAA